MRYSILVPFEPFALFCFPLHTLFPHLHSFVFQMFGFTHSPFKFIRLKHLTMKINCWGNTNSVFQLAYLLEAAPVLEDLHFEVSKFFLLPTLL
jgi:hypothetical protein